MASVNNINNAPSPEAVDQLFDIANEAVLKYAKDYEWSTYHSWNIVNQT